MDVIKITMKKRVIVILDGLGDVLYKQLGNKSPLEAAHTPNMDFLAANGKTGLMYPIAQNIAPESDEAMIALLGFNPFRTHTGRGPLEAHGADVKFRKGDVVFRCNFATVKDGIITDVRAGRPHGLKVKILARKLDKLAKKIISPKARFLHTYMYRSVLIIPGNLSPRVEGNHPGYRIVNSNVTSAQKIHGRTLRTHKVMPLEKKAEKTAHLMNTFIEAAQHLLRKEKKTNYILVRGAGNKLPKLKKLQGKWLLISEVPVEKGVGKIVGMHVIKQKGNLAKQVAKNWKKYDNFYFQIKDPDRYGHDGKLKGKVKSISKLDRSFFGKFLRMVDLRNITLIVTADHSTPCKYMAHSHHPVPILVFGKDIDAVDSFSEKACKKGKIGVIAGKDMMKLLK